MTLPNVVRALFWLCVLAIIVLSVLPGGARPHTFVSGHFEHFIAYAGTGLMFLPRSRHVERLVVALALAALSGAAEVIQIGIPGRTPEVAGFVYSTLGACVGLIIGGVLWSFVPAAKAR